MDFLSAQRQVIFNQSVYQANAVNRWMFLESFDENDGHGFLLRSPAPVVTATISYVLFVSLIGPALMRSRPAFELKAAIRLYNLIEVILAGTLMYKLHSATGGLSNFVNCDKAFSLIDGSATGVYRLGNFILAVRMSEYFDTIFFTLRKKSNQVTFLHVYHHAFVPLYAYWILRIGPARFNVYIIYINSAIHVLMYFYYFLATFQQPRASSQEAKLKESKGGILLALIGYLLRYKKYVTQLQILQFVSLLFYTLYAYLQPNSCGVPANFIMANFLLGLSFLTLFVHFYIASYKQSQAARAQTAKRNN